MDHGFVNKICLCLLISLFVSHREVNSQSNCSPIGSNFTNGVRAELIAANDGVSLLGIRVLWTIKTEYLNCHLSNMRVELNPGNHRIYIVITVSNSSADFYNLDCNTHYTPSVRASVSRILIMENGDSLFYGGTLKTVPYPLPRVCVGQGPQGRVKLAWDLLPCHLQNGADITSYIIQYSNTSGGVAQIISSFDSRLTCGVESDGGYRCLFGYSILSNGVSYTFQVAAVNSYGISGLSTNGPLLGMLNIQNKSCNSFDTTEPDDASQDTTPNPNTSAGEMSTPPSSNDNAKSSTESNIGLIAGVSGAAIGLLGVGIVLAGLLITSVIFNIIYWKRLKSSKESKRQQPRLHESEINMKESSAYGHETSTITTSAEEQHVYESAK